MGVICLGLRISRLPPLQIFWSIKSSEKYLLLQEMGRWEAEGLELYTAPGMGMGKPCSFISPQFPVAHLIAGRLWKVRRGSSFAGMRFLAEVVI